MNILFIAIACDLMVSLTPGVFSLILYGGHGVTCHLLISWFAIERVEKRGKLLVYSSDWNPVLANSRIMSVSPSKPTLPGILFSYSLGISPGFCYESVVLSVV